MGIEGDSKSETDRAYLSRGWMGLRWSAWMPLMAAHPLALAQLPSETGLYRVRRADRRDRLEWIGWAERGVREVAERLSRQVHLPVEPYDDPSSPALALWAQRRNSGVAFEVSGAPLIVQDEEGRAVQKRVWETYLAAMPDEGAT
jgi:hypothetical protein